MIPDISELLPHPWDTVATFALGIGEIGLFVFLAGAFIMGLRGVR